MADSDPPDDGPSLEMPSFSLRRRRRKDAPAEPAQDRAGDRPEAVADREPVVEPAQESTALSPAAETGPLAPEQPASRRRAWALRLPGPAAAVVVGAVVGLVAALAGALLGAGCEAVRGTSACGGAIGFPALVATLVVLAWLGGLLLRVLGVVDAGSTSTLAVALGAVVVLVALLGVLDRWWAVLALPVVGASSYALAWWVTAVLASSDDPATGRSGSR